jgi:hypothetical protein
MPLSNQTAEIRRLINAFEKEAAHFHGTRLSTFFLTQNAASTNRKFERPNHTIMLWQYWGLVESEQDVDRAVHALRDSNMEWAMRGAELSAFALLEGPKYDQFVRMAQRAGNLFDADDIATLASRVVDEIGSGEQPENSTAKPVAVSNSSPLAVWINFLLYHLSMTHPGREHSHRIEPDPFSLSLLALERLSTDQAIGKADRSSRSLADLNFKVALSFSGEQRHFVSGVADNLRFALGLDSLFYDLDYQAQLARPNLDTLLQDIYRNRSQLIVVFLSGEYAKKQWCGLEWRAVRDIIKAKEDDRVMFVRFDDAPVDGVLSIDGFIDARTFDPASVAQFILQRLDHLK